MTNFSFSALAVTARTPVTKTSSDQFKAHYDQMYSYIHDRSVELTKAYAARRVADQTLFSLTDEQDMTVSRENYGGWKESIQISADICKVMEKIRKVAKEVETACKVYVPAAVLDRCTHENEALAYIVTAQSFNSAVRRQEQTIEEAKVCSNVERFLVMRAQMEVVKDFYFPLLCDHFGTDFSWVAVMDDRRREVVDAIEVSEASICFDWNTAIHADAVEQIVQAKSSGQDFTAGTDVGDGQIDTALMADGQLEPEIGGFHDTGHGDKISREDRALIDAYLAGNTNGEG